MKKKKDIYCKTLAEFRKEVKWARANGYSVKLTPEGHKKEKIKTYAYVTLDAEIRFGKCGYCGAIIDTRGIYSHDRKCEECGKIIHKDYCRGDVVSFKFVNEENDHWLEGTVSLRVAKVDTKNNYIYFYTSIPRYRRNSIGALTKKQTQQKLDKALERGDIEYVIVSDKTTYIRIVKEFNNFYIGSSPINTYETRGFSNHPHARNGGGFNNCSVVRIWEGKEYSEYGREEFPITESYCLYRDWLVEKDIHEICRRAGMTSRPEYYSGRGVNRGDLNETHLVKIHDLIKRFYGDEQAAQFVEMVKDIDEMSATSFLTQLHNFFNNGLKHVSIKGDAREEVNNGVHFTTEMGALGTIMSVLGRSEFGNFFGNTLKTFGDSEVGEAMDGCFMDWENSSIKSSFLAKI